MAQPLSSDCSSEYAGFEKVQSVCQLYVDVGKPSTDTDYRVDLKIIKLQVPQSLTSPLSLALQPAVPLD